MYWRQEDGTQIKISDMSKTHLISTIKHIRKRIVDYQMGREYVNIELYSESLELMKERLLIMLAEGGE